MLRLMSRRMSPPMSRQNRGFAAWHEAPRTVKSRQTAMSRKAIRRRSRIDRGRARIMFRRLLADLLPSPKHHIDAVRTMDSLGLHSILLAGGEATGESSWQRSQQACTSISITA